MGNAFLIQNIKKNPWSPIVATGGVTYTTTINNNDYQIHEFNSVGTTSFNVTNKGTDGELEFLAIAGGGGGGRASQSTGNFSGGGGGAGGIIQNSFTVNSPQNFNIVVGGGGSGSSNNSSRGNNGGNSSCFGLTAFGGGGGGSQFITSGNSGGSGGGGSNSTGGTGTTGQGFNGGTSGGGGAGGSGSNMSGNFGGAGGTGLTINFTGSNISVGGGGGGASVARLYCGQVNENLTLSMATGVTNYIFDSVIFASYGTPGGTCPSFTLGSCHASNSSSVVGNAFLNRSSGSLGALNTNFGDPCSGIGKRLWVSLRGVPNSQNLNGTASFGGGAGRFNTNGLNGSVNTGGGGGGSVNGNGGTGGSGRIIIRYPLQKIN